LELVWWKSDDFSIFNRVNEREKRGGRERERREREGENEKEREGC
jgi:hypothetical protein